MHEATLMTDLMRRINEIAISENASRVTRVRVWLGALSHMSPAHFAEHFEQASAGTIAHGAQLDTIVSDDLHDPNAQSVLVESVDLET